MRKIIFIYFAVLLSSCASNLDTANQELTEGQFYYELGMSSFLLKNYSEAIANFNKATRLLPKDPKVWNALGMAYTEVEEYDKAEASFLKAIEVDRTFSEAYLNRGIMYYRKGDYAKAKEDLEKSIKDETFEKKHVAYYYLAKVYRQMGDSQMYVSNLTKASVYNPNFLEPQIELANFYEERKEYDKAFSIYLRLLQQNLQLDPKLKLKAAKTAWLAGDIVSAKFILSQLFEERNLDKSTYNEARMLLDQILIEEHKQKHNLLVREEEKPKEITVLEQKEEKSTLNSEDGKTNTSNVNPPTFQKSSFYIQVAVFSLKSNADSFKTKLEEVKGLKNVIVVEKDNLYKVMLGPYNSREDAERELNRIKKFKLNGMIVIE